MNKGLSISSGHHPTHMQATLHRRGIQYEMCYQLMRAATEVTRTCKHVYHSTSLVQVRLYIVMQ